MASRGKYGARPLGHPERDESRERPTLKRSERILAISGASSASRIPAYTSSFFSRTRTTRIEGEHPKGRNDTSSKRTAGTISRPMEAPSIRAESPAQAPSQSLRNLGFGSTATKPFSSAVTPTSEKRQRNVLRRKPSSADQHAQYARTESSMSSYEPTPQSRPYETASSPGVLRDLFAGSILGVAMPTVSSSTSHLPGVGTATSHQATSSSRMANYNPQSTPHAISTQNLPPPTPSFAHSSGSSTRRSESPGAFSRTSTPTSMSSHSPSIPLSAKSPIRLRQVSPTRSRPPVTRRRIGSLPPQDDTLLSRYQGLPALRESGTSSSSSSTVKGAERAGAERVEATQVHKTPRRLSPPPPSPPPRLSSKKFLQPRDEFYHSRHPLNTADVSQMRPERVFRTQINESESTQKGTTQPVRSSGPPPRPSREGTPKLDDNTGPSPIIQSNLSRLITTGHKRRESLDKSISSPDTLLQAAAIPRSTVGRSPSSASTLSIKPSRLPSPNPGSVSSLRPRPVDVLKTRDIPGLEANAIKGRAKDASPLSAGSNKPASRFGLFTKRTKSPLEATGIEGGGAKKGPTAGTGHEGYGKYAKRGRSGSGSTSASRGRSTSTGGTSNSLARTPTSRKSSITSREEPEMDDFLLERLAPVVISGGGALPETRKGGDDSDRKTSEDESVGRISNEGFATSRPLAYAQADAPKATGGPTSKDPRSVRRGSRVLVDGRELFPPLATDQSIPIADEPRRPTLAARRSLHRSQLFKEVEPIKIPAPINTQVVAPSPGVNSYDTMQSSALRTDSTQVLTDDIFEGREGNWLKPRKPEKRAKSPRKWNFFQRTHATPKAAEKKPLGGNEGVSELPVTISRIPDSRPVAHYAMIDSNDPEGSSSTVNLLSDTENLVQSQYLSMSPIKREFHADVHKESHKYSMLLPSPPKFPSGFGATRRSPSPIANLPPPDPVPLSAIPVDAPPKPKGSRLQQVGRIPRVISKRDRPHHPPPQSFSRPFVRPPAPGPEPPSMAIQPWDLETTPGPIPGVNTELLPDRAWENDDSAKPFSAPVRVSAGLTPPSREEFLTFPPRKGSEVSGSSGSEIFDFAATTAVVPQPGVTAGEDEVWNEYDELLDIVESPAPLRKGPSVRDENRSKRLGLTPAALHIRKESSVTGLTADPSVTPFETVGPTAALPSPPRKSSLLSPLHSAELVSTPLSFSDFFAGYGDRNRASAASKRQSMSTGSRYSQRSMISDRGSRYGRDNGGQKRNTEIMAEKTEPASGAESNLRFSALMTSRWLSFGRVLFSPAHMEIQSNRHDRVLVLDGLGNDDWSFYCALTYPHATVYNLSPFPDTSDRKRDPGAYDSPSNHRQIHHASIAHPFPFPKGFFTAAVFRFPVASSESACYNAISECKRVLRPGGYLEMSILDLDMVNMGNRARRAVRMLKVRMQVADPEVSLKPASDNMQKMLGRRGFENLNRCMVNVPIAGHISDSRAGSFEEKDMSLGDMLKDSSQQGDEGISKMVAKVGRWWYTRCYEMSVLPHGDMERSIWADRALLRECEKRETGLKLLICFAQKPSTPKRRTVSM